MKLLLIVSAIALTSALGCTATTGSQAPTAPTTAPMTAQRQIIERTTIECGMGNGECTAHFHANPKRRPEAKVEVNFFPIKGFKSELTSSLNR